MHWAKSQRYRKTCEQKWNELSKLSGKKMIFQSKGSRNEWKSDDESSSCTSSEASSTSAGSSSASAAARACVKPKPNNIKVVSVKPGDPVYFNPLPVMKCKEKAKELVEWAKDRNVAQENVKKFSITDNGGQWCRLAQTWWNWWSATRLSCTNPSKAGADGHCFFHSISWVLFGKEQFHKVVRLFWGTHWTPSTEQEGAEKPPWYFLMSMTTWS